jgi:hypothetical protein
MRLLAGREHREARSAVQPRFGTAITDALFMSSRDGVHFRRWEEAFLRPGLGNDNWVYGDNNPAWGLIQTTPEELSLYAVEHYWRGPAMRLRRWALRTDGFVSLHAPMAGGEAVTRPFTFDGARLTLNFSTSAAGSVRIEIQDADGRPIPGFTLAESAEHFGDAIAYPVPWKRASDLAALAGRPIRLRFVLKDADIYSMQFGKD